MGRVVRKVSITEAAERLGCSRKTIWRYIRKGIFTALRPTPRQKKVLIDEREIQAFQETERR